MDPLASAVQSNIAQYKSKMESQAQITRQSIEKSAASMVSLIQTPPQAEKIAMDGLTSRGGRVDIQV